MSQGNKEPITAWKTTNATLVASYWLRTLAKHIIKEEVRTAPIQYMKITRKQSPLYSFHVISIIVAYSRLNIPIPYYQNDGPLVNINDKNDEKNDENDYESTRTIIIEHGSSCIRAGFAGDDAPKLCIPSLVAIIKNDNNDEEIIIGNRIINDIITNQKPATIKSVIQRGKIIDWKYIKMIWQYVLRGIQIDSVNVHIVDAKGLTFRAEREKMTEIFFDKLKGKAFYISKSPLNSLYTTGRCTGMVIQCGFGITSVSTVYEGYILPHASRQIQYGKYDMDENNIKDYKIMFQQQKIAECVAGCIKLVDQDIRSDLCSNMVIAGGNSMSDDIVEYLMGEIKKEMNILNMGEYEVKLIAPPERAMLSWIGGSILGSIS
eukprot:401487_1